MTINIANGTIYQQGDGSGALVPYSPPPATTYGLLFTDGIEPTSSTLFPLASGKRIWFVDLDAQVNGDGSEGSPLNNFTDLIGFWDGVNYTQGSLPFLGGGSDLGDRHRNPSEAY